MPSKSRTPLLIAANWAFWAVNYYVTWNHLIPERFVTAQVVVATVFALPCGCCFFPFLVAAQFHDVGWPSWVYGSLTVANGIAWAWLIDLVWRRLMGGRPTRGFPMKEE